MRQNDVGVMNNIGANLFTGHKYSQHTMSVTIL